MEDHIGELDDAVEGLVRRIYWDRDRVVARATQLAAECNKDAAKNLLAVHTAYVLEQATQ